MMNEKIIIAVVGTRPNFVKMKTVVHFLSIRGEFQSNSRSYWSTF